jgi:hypothetical protein
MQYGYVSPKLEIRPSPNKGYGMFARQAISEGETLGVFGGKAIDGVTFADLPPDQKNHSLQVAEDVYLVTDEQREAVDFFNHSCAPNAGLRGQICLEAMRSIAVGEEVCFDYAMSDGSPYDEFECNCEAAECRRIITGRDWEIKRLQERYAGYFSPYIQKRIEKLCQKAS